MSFKQSTSCELEETDKLSPQQILTTICLYLSLVDTQKTRYAKRGRPDWFLYKWQGIKGIKQTKNAENTLNCLKEVFKWIWLHSDSLPWEKHLGSGGHQQGEFPHGNEVLGETCGGGCCCCAAAQKGENFPYHWLAQRFTAFSSAALLQSQVSGKGCLQAAKELHIDNERARKHPCSCHMDVSIGSQKEKH